jgi:cytochrome c oxidase subunit IV
MSHEHVSNTKRIWTVFAYLSVITIVEVILGIIKPGVLHNNSLLGLNLLNWVFIILTGVKAYYIVYAFMHMEGEKTTLRYAVIAPLIFLVAYLLFILLIEGHYVFEVFKNSTIKWNF